MSDHGVWFAEGTILQSSSPGRTTRNKLLCRLPYLEQSEWWHLEWPWLPQQPTLEVAMHQMVRGCGHCTAMTSAKVLQH